MTPRFSFLIPTRGRPHFVQRLLTSIAETTTHLDDLEVVLGVDDDDPDSQAITHPSVRLRKTILPRGLTMGEMNTACFKASTGRFVMLMNDDVVLRTKGWDLAVGSAFDQAGDDIALVHVNDLLFRERLCTFPFLSRRACLEIGVCVPGYRRYRIDDHIYDIYNLLAYLGYRRITYLEDVVFEHQNFEEEHGQESEQVFRSENQRVYVPDQAIIAVDAALFDTLFDQRKHDAVRLAAIIESDRARRREEVLAARLAPLPDSQSYREPGFVERRPPAPGPRGAGAMKVTVAVVTADYRGPHARECLRRLKDFSRSFELLVLDNNGASGFNHPTEMNRAIEASKTDYLVLLDDDVFVEDGWLEGLMAGMDDRTAVVAPIHKDGTGRISFTGVYMMGDAFGNHAHHLDVPPAPRACQALCSAALLLDLRKCPTIRFDTRYDKYFLDIDHSLQVWEAGYQIACTPHAMVTHLAGATLAHGSARSARLWNKDQKLFKREWIDSGRIERLRRGIWQTDPLTRRIVEIQDRIAAAPMAAATSDAAGLRREIEALMEASAPYPLLRTLLRQSLGEAMAAADIAGRRLSRDIVQRAIEGLHDAPVVHVGPSPILVTSHMGHNIVEYDGRVYAVPVSLGEVDFASGGVLTKPGVFTGASAEEVTGRIDEVGPNPAVPTLVGNWGAYNLVAYAGEWLAIPTALGIVDVTTQNLDSLPGIFRAADREALEADLCMMTGQLPAPRKSRQRSPSGTQPPKDVLIGTRAGHNLVQHAGRVWAVPQSAGRVDSTAGGYAAVAIASGASADEVRALVDAEVARRRAAAPADHGSSDANPPRVIREAYQGFTIVLCASKYFAIPEAEGVFSLERFRRDDYSRRFVGATLEETIREIDLAARPGGQRLLVLTPDGPSVAMARDRIAAMGPVSATILAPEGIGGSVKNGDAIAFRARSGASGGALDPDAIDPALLEQLRAQQFDAVAIPYGDDWRWNDPRPERLAALIAPRLIALCAGGPRTYKGEDLHRIIYNKSYLASMFTFVPDVRGKRLLEVGCGDGMVCDMMLTGRPQSIDGLDPFESVGCGYPSSVIQYHQGTGERLAFPDRTFDLTYSIATFEHVADPPRVLEEMRRVTKRGGYCYVQAGPLYFSPFGHHMFGYFDDMPWIHLRLPAAEIAARAVREGSEARMRGALGRDAREYVESMLSPDHVNGLLYREYGLEAFAARTDIEVLKLTRSFEGESLLSAEVRADLPHVAPGDLIAHGFEFGFRVR